MSYLLIENNGELDISSLVLLGASTKRGDSSKIGFFGSGNKYAIATLLRKGIPFKIFSGEKEVSIETEPVDFRGVTFKKILIDGQQTSLTTDMGPQWEPWMAIREWVSNSIDEGEHNMITSTDNVSGREGYTRFFVYHDPSITEMIENWNLYFTFDRDDMLHENSRGKIFTQTEKDSQLVLYRKGIRAFFSSGWKSLYQYDSPSFDINESRLIDNMYSTSSTVSKLLAECTNVDVCKNILNKAFKEETWESSLPWRWGPSNGLSSAWKEAIGNHVLIVDNVAGYFLDIQHAMPHYIVSIEMAQQIKRSFSDSKIYGMDDGGDLVAFKKVEPTAKEQYLLKECLNFCQETKYDISYPVEIVEFEQSAVLGKAHQGKILLSNKVFNEGRKQIVLTLVEENEHLKTGYKDCTRTFQNHLFSLFLSEKEERFGFFL